MCYWYPVRCFVHVINVAAEIILDLLKLFHELLLVPLNLHDICLEL